MAESSGARDSCATCHVAAPKDSSNATQTYRLSDTDFRQLLFAKAFANICRTVIRVISQLLMMVFGSSGTCNVQDNGGMTMSYV
jgi:hypothetical protein